MIRVEHPQGSTFKGYESNDVQELVITARAVHYRRERWLTPDGKTIIAPLPPASVAILVRNSSASC